jgi:hypothetical protein
MGRFLVGFALCLAAGAAQAQAVPPFVPEQTVTPSQTREGVPETMAAPATPSDPAVQAEAIGRFRVAYSARKSPRIAIFWNRTLTDDIEAGKLHVDSEVRAAATGGQTSTSAAGGSSTSIQPYGYGQLVQKSAGANAQTSFGSAGVTTRDRMSADIQQGFGARAAVMSEQDSWRFQDAFSDPFIKAGARLVDRNTMIRIAGDAADKQRSESAALAGLADLFVEVLMSVDPASPSGYMFRATAKDAKTGQIIADVISDGAAPDAGATEYVATDRGFMARPSRAAGAVNGTAVAIALMGQLSQAWQQ